jgi:hypothetical protein
MEATMSVSRLSDLANISVARGSAFGLLAIFCFMIGLAGYPVIALKSGAIALMVGAGLLIWKAEVSRRKPYRRTELWTMLEPHERPIEPIAQQVISSTLQGMFSRFAVYYAQAAVTCFAASLVLELVNRLNGFA